MIKYIRHELRRILNGSRQLDDDLKYSFLIIMLALIHFSFLIFYYHFKVIIFVAYNLASTIFYLVSYKILLHKKNYFEIFNIILVEVMFFASSSTLLLGWDFGYMLYFMCLIPVIFYLLFTNPKYYGNLKLPFLYSLGICIIFIVVKIISLETNPLYLDYFPKKVVPIMYLFNALLACLFQSFFSLLFVFEILHMQSALKSRNKELDNLASLDPLTQLCNRRSMERHLTHTMDIARASGKSFSVVIGDIDNFKSVNDTYGHDFGDRVLENVASILKSQMREDDYVCRWGGEEFLLLIRADKDNAKAVSERIRSEIEKSVVTDGNISLSVTMTFGIMSYIPGYSMDKLISMADANLYKGKQNGKNQVVS